MEGNAFAGRYSKELMATAKSLASAGKGILAADESTGTVGKRVRLHDLPPAIAMPRTRDCVDPASRSTLGTGHLNRPS